MLLHLAIATTLVLTMPTVNIGVRHPGCDYVCEAASFRETPEGLFVHTTNLSCDTRRTIDTAVASKWRNGRVELLDGNGRWESVPVSWEDAGRTLRLTGALPVFGSLALKIVPGR